MAKVKFSKRKNAFGLTENYVSGLHLSVQEIKEHLQWRPTNPNNDNDLEMLHYLSTKIPPYPNPVEFAIANVSHVTDLTGCQGILMSRMFKPPKNDKLWWNLHITDDEIQSAEKRFLEVNLPQESKRETNLLKKFTTSPLFDLKESPYGQYRFVFPLVELMNAYREQNCGGQEPVVRIYETITFKQEIVYSVLIHSPEDNEEFKEYSPLTKSKWVSYEAKQDAEELQVNMNDNQETKDGKIIWKAQAICETHWYKLLPELKSRKVLKNREQFYVWDQVSLVFHLPGFKAIKFPRATIRKALEECKQSNIYFAETNRTDDFMWVQYLKKKEFVDQLNEKLRVDKKSAVPQKTESADYESKSKKRGQETEKSKKIKVRRLENCSMEDSD